MPKLVTVIGGSGFIGRQVVQDLAQAGIRVRVGCRDPEAALDLKPMGDVGQVTPIQVNIRDDASVQSVVQGADAVVNLVGILAEGGKQKFRAVQAEGAGRVARAATAAGVKSFVQISAIGASETSRAAYARSKAMGEAAVREAFPDAVVLRPSIVFGPRDSFFNMFAGMAQLSPALPLIGGGKTKFQPVYVGDVAAAVMAALTKPETRGKTYELGGPAEYSFKELLEMMLKETGQKACLLSIPFPVAALMGTLTGWLPGAPLTRDQVEMLKTDNVVSSGSEGLSALGVTPTAIQAVLPTYMDVYRRGGRFASV
ncbi:complex I NDUFA9 subunit family protein [Hwanghaeella grinnelliae]|uniref:Complex I NDUFA9 subunit family protein n=1 Tax=Hwanghaeella grinnelliae TaxID=2500179 RepID=A0A3S2Z6U1_9PROT|nr:complex I NDUFA9 subunit family protein [Hwanghaeella grinnelliae]